MKNTWIITSLIYLAAFHLVAQDNLKMELKDAPEPDVYIDGKKYDHAVFNLLDQNKLESVRVIKGDQAVNEYNAPNGVIIIKSKPAPTVGVRKPASDNSKEPVIIIDGKVSNRESLSQMDRNDIESVKVIKGDEAIEKYNAANGAVVIETNQSKKKK